MDSSLPGVPTPPARARTDSPLQDALQDAPRRFETLTEALPRRLQDASRRPETPILVPKSCPKPSPRPLQSRLKIDFVFDMVFATFVL